MCSSPSRAAARSSSSIWDGSTWRALQSHPSTAADPAIVPRIDGQDFRKASTGKPQLIHVNLLEVSEDGQWLYYCCLFGPTLFRVALASLCDPDISDAALGECVEPVCAILPLAGMTRDGNGGFYLCSITENAIVRLGKDGGLNVLVQDARLSFPNEPSVGPDGALYVPCSQVHRLPMFHADGISRVLPPFQIYRIEVSG